MLYLEARSITCIDDDLGTQDGTILIDAFRGLKRSGGRVPKTGKFLRGDRLAQEAPKQVENAPADQNEDRDDDGPVSEIDQRVAYRVGEGRLRGLHVFELVDTVLA